MNQGMLMVWEETDQLCELMNQQSDSRLRTRLQMLYLLRIGAAHNHIQLARLLGVGRRLTSFIRVRWPGRLAQTRTGYQRFPPPYRRTF